MDRIQRDYLSRNCFSIPATRATYLLKVLVRAGKSAVEQDQALPGIQQMSRKESPGYFVPHSPVILPPPAYSPGMLFGSVAFISDKKEP
ncbi:MAG: hypothetical protein A2Z99_19585 [Treponema sp. GWB1_62_6]|nr:MAG: hypothetical protein A2Y36_12195 [Treponema sp. GWA1_62_8]OHE65865.1 MAG: hypothetical protein A2001_12045 [Treponema sp. GWC1_61_84]OHE72249.1 MAG: hypothetical protein A2Z99_19585 [Treponema sp. GWB1_62_6]OHE72427.1 MAG: hypothetical protein A2413_03790 [Treponema sp. RIFOXYC1_FULL_61_9]HCM28576.1 hypothetical protein [Treponema sp.]